MSNRSPTRGGVRALRNAAVAAGLPALLGALLWGGVGASPPAEPTRLATAVLDGVDEALAVAALGHLDAAWSAGDRSAFLAGAAPRGRSWASEVYHNLTVLGVEDISLRLLDESASTTRREAAFVADVNVQWTPGTGSAFAPRRTSAVTVAVRFAADGRPIAVADGNRTGQVLPIWLAGRLHVASGGGVVCIAVGRRAHLEGLPTVATRAARDVGALLGRLPVVAVVVPSGPKAAGRVLGSAPADLGRIAAVTATVDGSSDGSAPQQVVLNPAVFDRLGPRAAQFVLAHEITHAASGSTTASLPLWIAEGFADYVALDHTSLPLHKAAGQILRQVHRSGAPEALPSRADFSASARDLGRTYEASWLVFRMLAEHYGHRETLAFYGACRDGEPWRQALAAAFGLDVPSLVTAWRGYLESLATSAP